MSKGETEKKEPAPNGGGRVGKKSTEQKKPREIERESSVFKMAGYITLIAISNGIAQFPNTMPF